MLYLEGDIGGDIDIIVDASLVAKNDSRGYAVH